MSWIQENKVPAAILGVTGAGVIGLGVVLFNTWSAAGAAQEEYDTVNTSLASMKSAPLAPTPENLAAKQAQVKDYSDAVGKLSLVLYKLQPEDKPISNNDFQAKLKGKIADIKKIGGSRLPAEFHLAFSEYIADIPQTDEIASELSTYLDAMDEIVKMLLKSGVKSIDMVERSQLPSEKGEPSKPQQANKAKVKGLASRTAAPAVVNITERRQVRVMIRTDQAALQTLLSNLASPSEMPFFTVVRLLRIENEAKEGPPRVAAAATAPPSIAEPTTAVPNPTGVAPAKPASTGIQPMAPDSHVVLGKETLRAFLEIDLVKFVNPNTPAPATR